MKSLRGELQLLSVKKTKIGSHHLANTTAMDVEIRKGRNNEQYIYKVPRSVSKYFLIKDGNKSQMTRGPCRDHINQVSNHPPRPKYSGVVEGHTDPGSSSSGLL